MVRVGHHARGTPRRNAGMRRHVVSENSAGAILRRARLSGGRWDVREGAMSATGILAERRQTGI